MKNKHIISFLFVGIGLVVLGSVLLLIGISESDKWFEVTCYGDSGSIILEETVVRHGDNRKYYKNDRLVFFDDLDCLYTQIDEPQ